MAFLNPEIPGLENGPGIAIPSHEAINDLRLPTPFSVSSGLNVLPSGPHLVNEQTDGDEVWRRGEIINS